MDGNGQCWINWVLGPKQKTSVSDQHLEVYDLESNLSSFSNDSECKALSELHSLKEKANCSFQQKRFEEALENYLKALESIPDEKTSLKEALDILKLDLVTKLAETYIAMECFDSARSFCEIGLLVFPKSVKLRVYLSISLLAKSETQKALLTIIRAQKLSPKDQRAATMFQEITSLRKQQVEATKQQLQNMAGGTDLGEFMSRWSVHMLATTLAVVGIGILLYKRYKK